MVTTQALLPTKKIVDHYIGRVCLLLTSYIIAGVLINELQTRHSKMTTSPAPTLHSCGRLGQLGTGRS